jgi:hypothetical protein
MVNAQNVKDSDMSMKPLRPNEAIALKKGQRPDAIMIAFNQEISSKIIVATGKAKVLQKDVIARIKKALPNIPSQDLFDKGWLDVEGEFREAGWEVKYEKPARDESFDSYFIFQKKGTPRRPRGIIA